jgi:Ca-activated chloride channel family protein
MGNFKDSKLETLAKRGNGNFAYIDDINEAEKVLVKELTQTFYAVAEDVFMNIQFNPRYVKQYRLIGFDNKRDAVSDSTIDLEGGEIGSGNSVLAIFEIIPATDNSFSPDNSNLDGVAAVNMRYELCNDTVHRQLIKTCPANFVEFKNIDKELQFATAVTMFALKLKQSKYIKNADWLDIETIAAESYDNNSFLQAQFLELVNKAKKIYSNKKKKIHEDN